MMIESQLMPCGVVSPLVVTGFHSVPREDYVPAERRNVAYVDAAQPLADGREIMPPLSLGRLLEAAQPQPGERALVVMAGTGYAAAVLAAMAVDVTAVEPDPALAAVARKNLGDSVTVIEGAAEAGHAAGAPYDLLLVDGAIDVLPPALVAQLADGGRAAAVLRGTDGVLRASIGRKAAGLLYFDPVAEAGAPLLAPFLKREGFRF